MTGKRFCSNQTSLSEITNWSEKNKSKKKVGNQIFFDLPDTR